MYCTSIARKLCTISTILIHLDSSIQYALQWYIVSFAQYSFKTGWKRVENIEETRANIKVCSKLCHSVKQIFTALGEWGGGVGEVYMSHNVSY